MEITVAAIRTYAHLRRSFQQTTASQSVNTAMAGKVRSIGSRSLFTLQISQTAKARTEMIVAIFWRTDMFFQFMILFLSYFRQRLFFKILSVGLIIHHIFENFHYFFTFFIDQADFFQNIAFDR